MLSPVSKFRRLRRRILIALLAVTATLPATALLAPIDAAAQALPQSTGCLIAGNGGNGFGAFPAAATFSEFADIWEVEVGNDGTVYLSDRGVGVSGLGGIVKISPSGIAEVLVAEGGPVAGRTMGEPFGLDLTNDGDLWITSNDLNTLVRINADGTEDDLTALLPPGVRAYGVSVDDAGRAYVSTIFGLIRLDPDGTSTTMIPETGLVIDGRQFVELKAVAAAPAGGASTRANTKSTCTRPTLGRSCARITSRSADRPNLLK